MRESYIENYFRKECVKQGMKSLKMLPTFEFGIPDRMALFKGVSGFAEIKAPGKEPRTVQLHYMRGLKKAGFFVGVVDSKESALKWIEDFKTHVKELTGC